MKKELSKIFIIISIGTVAILAQDKNQTFLSFARLFLLAMSSTYTFDSMAKAGDIEVIQDFAREYYKDNTLCFVQCTDTSFRMYVPKHDESICITISTKKKKTVLQAPPRFIGVFTRQ